MEQLNLKPWQRPPCWIVTEAEADAVLAKGPRLSHVSGEDIGDHRPARLLRRMLRHGVSVFHPDPVRAIKEAQKAKAK